MKNEKTTKNILAESLADFKAIEDMISKRTESTITDIISEKIKDGLKNIITEADENDFEEEELSSEEGTEDGLNDVNLDADDSLEGEDEPEEVDIDSDIDVNDEEGAEMEPEEGEGEEDFDFDEFKTGEDEYDLTNNSIEDVVKVFKKIDDNDSIIVKKLENGKVELIDNEAGTDYLIDMGGEEDDEIEIEMDDEDSIGEEVNDEDVDVDVEAEDENLTEDTEIEVELNGAEDEIDEKNITQSIGTNRRAGRMTQTRKANAPGVNNRDGAKLIANESKKIAEAYSKKIKQIEEAYASRFKAINEEVSQYKKALTMFRDKLKENAVLNNNLAKYVKLVTENATTRDEKLEILERFSKEGKTIESGNELFETINRSLNKKGTNEIGVNIDKHFSAVATKRLDEQVIYQSKDLQDTIGLIKRMNSLK